MASENGRTSATAVARYKEDYTNSFEVLERIGRGSFGTIRKVRHRATGQVLARKEISYASMTQRERDQLTAEIKVLEKLHHPNIVKYQSRNHISASKELHLYMEYCSDGDLGEYIKRLARDGRHADEQFVWSILAQLASALFLCHTGELPPEAGDEGRLTKPKVLAGIQRKDENHIVLHRDLKPENVFLTNGSTVKLGDFGLSRVLQAHDFASTYVGTPFYMSPELCSSEKYSAKSDIWSLGCIIYELCAQDPPFNGRNHVELIQNIRLGKMKEIPSFYSKELRSLVKQCLRVSQDDRPDILQILQEPLVKLARLQLHMDIQRKAWAQTQRELDDTVTQLREENNKLKNIGKQLEMEWHAKATLHITEKVDAEKARLQQELEDEKTRLVKVLAAELEKRSGQQVETELSNMTLETSPLAQRVKPRRPTRTPFTRAKTVAYGGGSPMDISSPQKDKTPLLSTLTPSRKAPKAPRSFPQGQTIVQLGQQSPAKWRIDLDEDMPSPFLKKMMAV